MPDSNLMAVVNVKGTLGTSTAKRLLLPSYFFETRSKAPFVNEEKRLTPVDMEYSSSVTEQLTYMLPAGVTVEGASADANVLWAGHAQYLTKSKTEPGQIAIARLLARAFTDAKPEEYQDLRGFYSKVAAADQAEVVLTAAAAPAKGN
jgi:hypothetical protein